MAGWCAILNSLPCLSVENLSNRCGVAACRAAGGLPLEVTAAYGLGMINSCPT